MKKICVSMVVVYIVIMICMAKTVLSQDVLGITPILVGVVLIIYAGILLWRESRLIDGVTENSLELEIDKYFSKIKQVKKRTSYLRHDFANHAQVLMELVDTEKCPKRDELISEIRAELIDKTKVSYSDNEMLNLALELAITELNTDSYKIDTDIALYGLKEINVNIVAYNIWMLIEVAKKCAKESGNISIKLSIKDNNQEKLIISYKLEADANENAKRIESQSEYKIFKEQLNVTGGTSICNASTTKFAIGGWMEVLKDV